MDPHQGQARPVYRRTPFLAERLFPVLATVVLIAVGMLTTTWGALLIGEHSWALPHDLWRTLVAAQRLRELDLAGLYTPPTALVTFPGAALMLVPVVAVIDAIGLGLGFQNAQNPFPVAWLVAGPYEIVLSASVLFAAEVIAVRLGADRRSRALLAAAGAVAVWNVSVRWGHPEDAVAVALMLYAVVALSDSRPVRSAWLVGAAVAVQPLVLLGLPVLLVTMQPRRVLGFLATAAVPGTLLFGAAAAANWHATLGAVTRQPNWPTHNHSTPWTALAPQLGGGAVAAGPSRALAILFAGGCAVVVARRWRARRLPISSPPALSETLWWLSLALAFRCVFEPVMVAYYLWPVLAVALIASSAGRQRLVATSVAVTILTFASQASSRGPWAWWGSMVVGLALTLLLARPQQLGPPGEQWPVPAAPTEPGR